VSSIYLDYAATTPLDPDVLRAMMPFLGHEFGNPSSIYQQAQSAKAAIEDARQKVAGVLGLDPAEIVFTSGATESDNLALAGVVWAAKKGGGWAAAHCLDRDRALRNHRVAHLARVGRLRGHVGWMRSGRHDRSWGCPKGDHARYGARQRHVREQ